MFTWVRDEPMTKRGRSKLAVAVCVWFVPVFSAAALVAGAVMASANRLSPGEPALFEGPEPAVMLTAAAILVTWMLIWVIVRIARSRSGRAEQPR